MILRPRGAKQACDPQNLKSATIAGTRSFTTLSVEAASRCNLAGGSQTICYLFRESDDVSAGKCVEGRFVGGRCGRMCGGVSPVQGDASIRSCDFFGWSTSRTLRTLLHFDAILPPLSPPAWFPAPPVGLLHVFPAVTISGLASIFGEIVCVLCCLWVESRVLQSSVCSACVSW